MIASPGTSLDWKTPARFLAEINPTEVFPTLRLLLTSDGSMTAALEALVLGPIDVEVVHQGEEPLDDDTADRLGVPPRQTAVVRHVWLTHRRRKLLYASSVLPSASLSAELAEGLRRGSQPLGRLVDACGGTAVRDGLRIGRLQDAALAGAFGADPSERLWCRVYRLTAEGTLSAWISEVFSPHLAERR
ncbi:MAG: chorismate lyase [Nitrospiria bacterium]